MKSDEEFTRLQEMIGLEELKFERRTIFDEVRLESEAKGKAKGKAEGKAEAKQASLDIFNSLDPERLYSVEEIAEKFGFSPDELINLKSE